MKDVNERGDETLYYGDSRGYIYQMVDGAKTDHGAALNPYVMTQPIGYKMGSSFMLRRVNIDATNDCGIINVDVYANDNQQTPVLQTRIKTFTDWREAVYSPGGAQADSWTQVAKWGVAKWVARRVRRKFNTFSQIFRNVMFKVYNSVPEDSFRIGKIEAEVIPIGRRP
jgi:hypothetical protein